jgi:hypothetical protein
MVAGIESECRAVSRRNGGRFPVGIVAGFGRNTQAIGLSSLRTPIKDLIGELEAQQLLFGLTEELILGAIFSLLVKGNS